MENINTQKPEGKKNNTMIIIIVTCVVAALIAAFIIISASSGCSSKKDGKGNGKEKATSTVKSGQMRKNIDIVKHTGSDSATKKLDISIRDVSFGDKVKKVKAFEKNQKDTVNSPSEATTKDGYTYLTYTLTPDAKFFGVKPADSSKGSLLQYVFKKKKLFDIRIQFGDISKKDQDKVRKALKDKYGSTTSYVEYDNDSFRDTWRSSAKNPDKETILSYNYSPQSGVVVAYESVGRDFGKK